MSEYRESYGSRPDELDKIDLSNLLVDISHGIRKLWWLVIALTVIFAVQTYFSARTFYQPHYVASATMSVRASGSSASYINAQSAKQMAEVFPYILTSGVLSDVVAEDMGLDYVPGTITATADEGTNWLTLSVSAGDAQTAYDVLQSVIENYPKVAEFVIGETELTILDETGVPEDTGREVVIRGSIRRGAIKGAALGILIMGLYILTRRTVKSRKDLKKGVNLEDFGSLPYIPEKKRRKKKFLSSVNLMNERVPQAYLEAVRKIRIRVMNEMQQKEARSLLVTSSVPGEGKTTMAVNLAIAMAKQGTEVILVDCDPRNPSVASYMNEKEKHPGLGAVLRGKVSPEQALTPVKGLDGKLRVLYGGAPDNRDARLLGTRGMKKLIDMLKEQAEVVILDTAPSELLADAPTLGKFVDCALYVIKYDHARLRQIRNGIRALDMSGVDILGYVFNQDHSGKSMGYGYSYGYRRYGGYGGYGGYGHYQSGRGKKDTYGRVQKD